VQDQFERGDEVMRLVPGLVSGELTPTVHVETLPMLMPTNSTDEGWPMHDANFFAAALEEKSADVVDCTIFHGYQFCDIEHVGVHVITTTNGDPDLARRTGQEMARWIWEQRDRFLLELIDAEQAVADALAVPQRERQGRPVVIHETSDNPGGGATGDATYLIAAMLERGPFPRGQACFGFIVDPVRAHPGSNVDTLRYEL
jgi:microcystin degradation protein MlrC